MVKPVLTLRGVHTHIGEYHILQGVDLTVPATGITVLLGRNGAGKTTTLRTVMGLWRASSGQIIFDGQDITNLATSEVARRGVAFVPEDMGMFSGLTVQENLRLAARSGKPDTDRVAWIFDLFPALKRFWLQPSGTLSGGQKQMLAVARAIVEPRKLLLIDEPTKGLAPSIVDNLLHALFQLSQRETAVFLVEQNFHFVQSIGEHVIVIDDGRTVHRGPMSELVADEGLQSELLGMTPGAIL